ncbi:MAG: hypothetical protein FJ405_11600 [Verrucomicrobia bacterium]|nr:hypothetical protein [Verrucomicrobiota bacterium]
MFENIQKLLVLQDRDQKLMVLREELQMIPAEQVSLESKSKAGLAALEQAKLKVKQLESERKKLELDVEAKKGQIEKYSLQQFQTKKNEEYRALANEIETCKAEIIKLDDQQIVVMERIEQAQKEAAAAAEQAQATKKTFDSRIAELKARQEKLSADLTAAEAERSTWAAQVDESLLNRYERIQKNKPGRALVGITHGVCGGCHMGLSRSIVLQCQGGKELVLCPNCSRILYYTRDMDLAVAE